jgi:hypothetical protein
VGTVGDRSLPILFVGHVSRNVRSHSTNIAATLNIRSIDVKNGFIGISLEYFGDIY